MPKKEILWKHYALPLLIFAAAAAVFFWIVKDSWRISPAATTPVNRSAMAENVGGDREAVQVLTVGMDEIESVSFDLYVQDPEQEGTITVTLVDPEGQALGTVEKAYGDLTRDGFNTFIFPEPVRDMNGKRVALTIHTDGGIWLGYGSTMSAGKIDVGVETPDPLLIGGEALEGSLVLRQGGNNLLHATERYWPAVGILAALYIIATWIGDKLSSRGRGLTHRMREIVKRYRYLLKQLVLRDFKVKYKASLLGVFWSFLNPLLMTLVYYVVFSNLFNTEENFVVYLMSGTVLFNYVSEATSLGLSAIVSNAGLITKVYMPKYIYPISKVLSSAINLLIAMIPMMVLMALNHLPFTKGLLLIPVLVFMLILFCTGLSLILSALMVFFRDTQFLWSVIILMWNFLSPVFYPESIIPATFIATYRMNPLYQYMTFLRNIVLYGMVPGPACFGFCAAAAVISLALGLLIFRSLQNKFAVYL